MARSVTILLCSLGLLSLARSQCLTGNDNPKLLSADIERLADARFDFAIESMKRMVEIEPQENIFYSPHSLHEALSLAYFGARGPTEESLKRALQVPEDFAKIDFAKLYFTERSMAGLREAKPSGNYEYQTANRLFLSKDKKLKDCMFEYFSEELARMDFKSSPEAAREMINKWVSNVTRDNIKDFLPGGTIDESTDAVLANAVYFKGLWQSKFDPKSTKKDVFYLGLDNNMTFVTFMRQKGSFNHMVSEELGAHILQLPYKGEDISMYVLLPPFVSANAENRTSSRAKPDGVQQLLQRITEPKGENAKELRDILDNGMPARDVELAIPKFSMERSLPTEALLSAMNASDVLGPKGNFTGFSAEGEDGVTLGSAIHRAKIELTEEGTTAAAATALFSFRSSRPTEPALFLANHPFAYFIYDKQTRAVLFAGIYRKPEKK